MKSKDADILGSLSPHIAEVSLPPEGHITYRTQAGPIATRAQAQSICDQLKSRGSDCFVVETALFTGPLSTLPAQATAPSAPAAPQQVATANVPPPTAAQLPAPQPLPAADVPPPPAASAAPPPPEAQVQPQTPAPPIAAPAPAPVEAPAVAYNAPATSAGGYVPGREPRMLGGDAPIAQAPPSTGVEVAPAPQAAVSMPASVVVPPESQEPPPLNPPAQERPGFFARLFNFGGSSTPPVPQEPAPLMAAPAPVVTAAPAPAPVMVPPPPPVQAAPAYTGTGSVSVAEAIRVPLTNREQHRRAVIASLPPVHGLGGSPSDDSLRKTYWTQLSYFTDENAARSFYEQFRATYPQFSDGVRMRVTHPYASSHSARVSLRIGPFATMKDSRTICVAAGGHGLRCLIIRDIGASSADSTVRVRPQPYNDFENRTLLTPAQPEPSAVAQSPFSSANYWVQLGSFPTTAEAWDTWQTLQESNRKLLKHLQASVSSPPSSSSLRPIFRLRAGPFTNSGANSLCSKLQASGASCIVLADQ